MRVWLSAVVVLLCLASSGAYAQEHLVVKGYSSDQTSHAVEEIVQPRTDRQIARWNQMVCPQFVGFPADVEKQFEAHLEDRFARYGILVKAHCPIPQLFILATVHEDDLIDHILERDPYLMQGIDVAPGVIDNFRVSTAFADNFRLPPADVRHAIRQDYPVRWFSDVGIEYNGQTGTHLLNGNLPPRFGGGRATALYIGEIPMTSFLGSIRHEDIKYMAITVDLSKMEGVSWPSLFEYVSMVALTNPQLKDYDTSETILGSFVKHRKPQSGDFAMTDLDDAVVREFYTNGRAEDGREETQKIASDVRASLHP